jgi:hypothetical protein
MRSRPVWLVATGMARVLPTHLSGVTNAANNMHRSHLMSDAKNLVKSFGIVGAIILCAGAAIVGCVYYLNWSAEKKANAFCADIVIGSDISLATQKANRLGISFGSYKGYTFYFPGTMFTKAICSVSVDQAGKVVSKAYEMEYD